MNLILKWVKKIKKLFIISRVVQNFKKFWIFAFFGNIYVNNGLKHFVLGSLNAEFCYLPYYYIRKKLIVRYFINYKLLCECLKTSAWRLLHSSVYHTLPQIMSENCWLNFRCGSDFQEVKENANVTWHHLNKRDLKVLYSHCSYLTTTGLSIRPLQKELQEKWSGLTPRRGSK